jgi:hypothetical protein
VVPRMTNNSLETDERAEPRKKGGRGGITVRRFLARGGCILGLLDVRATASRDRKLILCSRSPAGPSERWLYVLISPECDERPHVEPPPAGVLIRGTPLKARIFTTTMIPPHTKAVIMSATHSQSILIMTPMNGGGLMVPFYAAPPAPLPHRSTQSLRKPNALKCTLAAFLVSHGSLAVINVAVVLTLAGQWVSCALAVSDCLQYETRLRLGLAYQC